MRIVITPTRPSARQRKLADVELQFTEGPLAGLGLRGFAVYGDPATRQPRDVRVPEKRYEVKAGDWRVYHLLRGVSDPYALDRLKGDILTAYLAKYGPRAGAALQTA